MIDFCRLLILARKVGTNKVSTSCGVYGTVFSCQRWILVDLKVVTKAKFKINRENILYYWNKNRLLFITEN